MKKLLSIFFFTTSITSAAEISTVDFINAQDVNGNTALHNTIFYHNYNQAEALIQSGADVNIPNNEGNTPLHCAAKERATNIATLLINHSDTIINQKNKSEETVLHILAQDHKGRRDPEAHKKIKK